MDVFAFSKEKAPFETRLKDIIILLICYLLILYSKGFH